MELSKLVSEIIKAHPSDALSLYRRYGIKEKPTAANFLIYSKKYGEGFLKQFYEIANSTTKGQNILGSISIAQSNFDDGDLSYQTETAAGAVSGTKWENFKYYFQDALSLITQGIGAFKQSKNTLEQPAPYTQSPFYGNQGMALIIGIVLIVLLLIFTRNKN